MPPQTPTPAPEDRLFDYDVFISYSHDDRDWVDGTLLPMLEGAGLRVYIDYRDSRPGAPSVREMERAVVTARKTLLVLTPAYVNSAWAEFENLMLATLDPANRELRLIPLLKEACNLPLRIGYLTYVDFTEDGNDAIARCQLLTALGAAPPPDTPQTPTPANWLLAHPYAMPPNFTGRVTERRMLTAWLTGDATHPLLVLRALGGFGKSALGWHWLTHDVDARHWPRVVWWSFYETDAAFESFLVRTLVYLGNDPRTLNPRQQVDTLLRTLFHPGTLLILDGFERQLRAFSGLNAAYQGDDAATADADRDCVSPLAELFLRSVAVLPGLRGKVLMTTRLTPRALEQHGAMLHGCCETELTQLNPADAVAFLRAQGIHDSRAELERAGARYGYHPLSLRLLAGLVLRDLRTPGDIRAARRLDVSGDLVQRQHHVLAQAYDGLSPARRTLLSRIACFRGGVDYEALHALADDDGSDADVTDLLGRGLLHREQPANRFDLHPIVRRYAYDRLGGDARSAAHAELRDYFAAVPAPDTVQRLDDLQPVIELYHHTVHAKQFDEARTLFRDRLAEPLYFQFGAYQHQIELLRLLFPDGEDRPPRLQGESDQAWTLNELANSYSLSGQPRRAVPLIERQNAIQEKLDNKRNLAAGLGNVVTQQLVIGALRDAAANLRRSINLGREIQDKFEEASEHQKLGRLLAYCGAWATAEEELATAFTMFEDQSYPHGQGVVMAYRALKVLLLKRIQLADLDMTSDAEVAHVQNELNMLESALKFANEWARTRYPIERVYVRINWLLGAAQRVNGDLHAADHHLTEALTRCRNINMVDHEADILLDLARLRVDQAVGAANPDDLRAEALRLAEEALIITERNGYGLQGADVNLFLAEQAKAAGDLERARQHAATALDLATCDGPPDYTYKVAYEEAKALVAELGA